MTIFALARRLDRRCSCAELSPDRPDADRSRLLTRAAVAAAVALALWLTWPAWHRGLLLNRDSPRHALRAREMLAMLRAQGRVDGWSWAWQLGAPLFLFHSYGSYLLQAVFAACAARLSGIPLAHAQALTDKLAAVTPIIAMPPLLYRLARRAGLGRCAGAAAALLSLVFGTETGYGMIAAFGVGLQPHTLGIVLLAWTLPLLLDPSRLGRRRLAAATLLTGATFVVHFISALHLVLCAFVLAATSRNRHAAMLRVAILSAGAIALAAHVLLPALELGSAMGPTPAWGWKRIASAVLSGTYFGPRPLFVLALAGAGVLATTKRAQSLLWLVAASAVLALLPPVALQLPAAGRALAAAVQPRALALTCMLMPVLAGAALEEGARLARARGPFLKLSAAVLGVYLAAVCAGELGRLRAWVRTEETWATPASRQCSAVLSWLATRGYQGAVVAYEPRVLPPTACGTTSIASLINLRARLATLTGDQAELSLGPRHVFAAQYLAHASAAQVARWIERYRIEYVLVRSPQLERVLAAVPALRRVYSLGGVTAYQSRLEPHVATGPGLDIASVENEKAPAERPWGGRTRFSWQVANRSRLPRPLLLSITYHPNWEARLDGRPLVLERTRDWLMVARIPPGRHRLDLRFGRRPRERAYQAASLAALIVLAVAALFPEGQQTQALGPRSQRPSV